MKIAIVVALFLGVAYLPSILFPDLQKEKTPATVEETKRDTDHPIVTEIEETGEAIESETEALITEAELEEPRQLEPSIEPQPLVVESEMRELKRTAAPVFKPETKAAVTEEVEAELPPEKELKRAPVPVFKPETEAAVTEEVEAELQPEKELKRAPVPVFKPETEAAVTEEVEAELPSEKELKREPAPVLEPQEIEATETEELKVELQAKRKIPEEAEDTRAISLPTEAIEVELIPSPSPPKALPPKKEPAVEEKERVIEVSPLPGPTLPEVVPERRLVLVLFSLPGDPANLVLKQLGQGLRETNLFKVVSLNLPLLEESLIETTRNIAHLEGVSMKEAVDIWGANVAITGKVVSNTYFSSMVLNVKLLRLPDGKELLSRTILTSRDRVESEIEALIEEIKDQFPIQQGRVIQVEGDYIILDLGYLHGLKEGMELLVYRVGGLLKESAQGSASSGEIMGARTEDVAIIRVDKVTDKSARASLLELFPVQEIKVGDRVISR
ncbi:MAG: hypothetical protein AB1797_01275 [bacterium]